MKKILYWIMSPMACFMFAGANATFFLLSLGQGNYWGLFSLFAAVWIYHLAMRDMARAMAFLQHATVEAVKRQMKAGVLK